MSNQSENRSEDDMRPTTVPGAIAVMAAMGFIICGLLALGISDPQGKAIFGTIAGVSLIVLVPSMFVLRDRSRKSLDTYFNQNDSQS